MIFAHGANHKKCEVCWATTRTQSDCLMWRWRDAHGFPYCDVHPQKFDMKPENDDFELLNPILDLPAVSSLRSGIYSFWKDSICESQVEKQTKYEFFLWMNGWNNDCKWWVAVGFVLPSIRPTGVNVSRVFWVVLILWLREMGQGWIRMNLVVRWPPPSRWFSQFP